MTLTISNRIYALAGASVVAVAATATPAVASDSLRKIELDIRDLDKVLS